MTYFYISFATDAGFRGATVVEARNAKRAFQKATRLGLNPGGEAAILGLPDGAEKDPEAMAGVRRMLNRLCGKDELLSHGAERVADMPKEIQDVFGHVATCVCEKCNGN